MRIVADTIYKTADERTDPVGGTFGLEDEYRALQQMHRAGAAVPEPRGYDHDRDEYGMEHIDGATVQDLDTVYGDITATGKEAIAVRLEEGLEQIHESGIPHGDVCTSNIIVDDDLGPHYIDPVGVSPDHPATDDIMERDRQNLAYITDRFL